MSSSATGCIQCKKKSLLNMKCKCDKMVCMTCRYPDKHGCSFDYTKEQQKKLEKENPVVSGEKLQKV